MKNMIHSRKLISSKRGVLNVAVLRTTIITFLLVVILFKFVAQLFPQAASAGDELQASGLPFGEFFQGDGIIWLAFAAGLVILLVFQFIPSGTGR